MELYKNRVYFKNILLLSLLNIILFFAFEYSRIFIPENLFVIRNVAFKTIGFLIISIFILNSILIPQYLSKILQELTMFEMVCLTGLVIFAIELTFKIIQTLLIFKNLSFSIIFDFTKNALIICILSMSMANIKVHVILGKSTTIPILSLIIIWFSIAHIFNLVSN